MEASHAWGGSQELGKDDPGGGKEMVTGAFNSPGDGGGSCGARQGTVGDWYEERGGFGSWLCSAAGEGTVEEIPANMKPFTKKRLGGGTFASVRVVSSLLYLPIPTAAPHILEEEPRVLQRSTLSFAQAM